MGNFVCNAERHLADVMGYLVMWRYDLQVRLRVLSNVEGYLKLYEELQNPLHINARYPSTLLMIFLHITEHSTHYCKIFLNVTDDIPPRN